MLLSYSLSNPVKVNAKVLGKSSKHVLAHKDVISVGDRSLRWEYSIASQHHPNNAKSTFNFATPTKFTGKLFIYTVYFDHRIFLPRYSG